MKIYNERAMLEAIEFYELFDEFESAREVRLQYQSLKNELNEQQIFKFKNLFQTISIKLSHC